MEDEQSTASIAAAHSRIGSPGLADIFVKLRGQTFFRIEICERLKTDRFTSTSVRDFSIRHTAVA